MNYLALTFILMLSILSTAALAEDRKKETAEDVMMDNSAMYDGGSKGHEAGMMSNNGMNKNFINDH